MTDVSSVYGHVRNPQGRRSRLRVLSSFIAFSSMRRASTAFVLYSVGTLLLFSCGDSGPTPPSPVIAGDSQAGFAPATTLEASARSTQTTTVEQILANAGEFIGTQVQLQGNVTQAIGDNLFVFDDGTGTIPANFVSAGSSPLLNQRINVVANVGTGVSGFPASLLVS